MGPISSFKFHSNAGKARWREYPSHPIKDIIASEGPMKDLISAAGPALCCTLNILCSSCAMYSNILHFSMGDRGCSQLKCVLSSAACSV